MIVTYYISQDVRKESTTGALQIAAQTNGWFLSASEVKADLKNAGENPSHYKILKITIELVK